MSYYEQWNEVIHHRTTMLPTNSETRVTLVVILLQNMIICAMLRDVNLK